MSSGMVIQGKKRKNSIEKVRILCAAAQMTQENFEEKSAVFGYQGRIERLHQWVGARSLFAKPLFARDFRKRRCVVSVRDFCLCYRDCKLGNFEVPDSAKNQYLLGIWNGCNEKEERFALLMKEKTVQKDGTTIIYPLVIKQEEIIPWIQSYEAAVECLKNIDLQERNPFHITIKNDIITHYMDDSKDKDQTTVTQLSLETMQW